MRVLFLTDRGKRQQEWALQKAPAELKVDIRRQPDPIELAALLKTADCIISERNQPITAAMINAAESLKLIVRLGSLSHDIDIAAAKARGVRVSVQPVIGTIYCAEYALMMILAVTKRLGRSLHAALAADHGKEAQQGDEDTFSYNWMQFEDIGGLYGKTVSIVGMGEIGVELARRLRGFRVKVLYNKRIAYPTSVEQELGLTFASVEECAAHGDVIVSLLPYSEATRLSLNSTFFANVQRGSIFVHLGSGNTVDEQALIDALRSGQLAGASLDTYEYEPLPPTHPLIAYASNPNANLLLTPHTAGASYKGPRNENYLEIMRFHRGEPLQFEV